MWTPIYGPRPGVTSVALTGFIPYMRVYWQRLTSIASRPLAMLLQAPGNEARYLKCVLYCVYVRICCAQDVGHSALPPLTLVNTHSANTSTFL
ncbi:unnamed protein product [Nesidiocoris tenuis]|uniref:Uncharacterized protein n=1 Tax=Nesidiocoris tenuis TaxID=355587 RepID=A0A6H5HQU5_9HEMI|nr:unnamed protein product [Nesidiocoris tenuis]